MLKRILAILWPSFLAAAMAEGFFFSLFDPHDLLLRAGDGAPSPIAVYTVGFFFFWAFCSLASMLTYYLMQVPNDRKGGRPPF